MARRKSNNSTTASKQSEQDDQQQVNEEQMGTKVPDAEATDQPEADTTTEGEEGTSTAEAQEEVTKDEEPAGPSAEELAEKAKQVSSDHPLITSTSQVLEAFVNVMGPVRVLNDNEAASQQTNLMAQTRRIIKSDDGSAFADALSLLRKTIKDNPQNTFGENRVFRGIQNMRGSQSERRSYEMFLMWLIDLSSSNSDVKKSAKGKNAEDILAGARFSSAEVERVQKWVNKYT